MCTHDAEKKIADLAEFKSVFGKLRRADAETARHIETAVRAAMQGVTATPAGGHERVIAIKDAQLRMQELRYHYAAIGAQMAEQKAYFYRAAIEAEQAFLDRVYRGLEQYFSGVYDAVEEVLTRDSSWLTGLLDTWHKTGGRAINWVTGKTQRLLISATDGKSVKRFEQFMKDLGGARGKGMVNRTADMMKDAHQWLQQHAQKAKVEERSLLERALEDVCASDKIEENVAGVLEAAWQCYQQVWRQRVQSYREQIVKMQRAAELLTGTLQAQSAFSLGHAEQALATGMGAAIFGTAALAAGWHTLAYAMMNIFWPMAVFVAILTTGVAWFTRERAVKQRIEEARKVLNAYHAQLIMYIDTHKLEDYGGKSIRELVREHSLGVAEHMDRSWRQARFGALGEEHYRELMEACERHAARLSELAEGCQKNNAHSTQSKKRQP